MTDLVEKLKKALESIVNYTSKKKPKTLAEATHMLTLVELIAQETLNETAELTS